MNAVDTNVLVRYITDDVPHLAAEAVALIESTRKASRKLLVTEVVIAETAKVLDKPYGFSKGRNVAAINGILTNQVFMVEDRKTVESAFRDWQSSPGGFADCLIRRTAQRAGAKDVHTFETKLRNKPGWTRV